jgi:phytoene synthase
MTRDMTPALGDDFRLCQEDTRTHARSFYFASHVLPKGKRRASYAIYSFCRTADNIVDSPGESLQDGLALKRLDSLREDLNRAYSADPPGGKLEALADTVQRYKIPRRHFHDLLRGVAMDVSKTRYATFEELNEYCYCVASVVGLMMTHVFGFADDRALTHATHLGTAMQLTNILRDVGEDYRLGRIYLPEEDLRRFGIDEAAVARGEVSGRFRALMQFQIARAREYYAKGDLGIPLLTNDGSRYCVRLMSATYSGILRAIEENEYDVFRRRAYVPTAQKLLIAARTALRPAARLPGPGSAGERTFEGTETLTGEGKR